MPNENQQAADEFRKRLRELHERGAEFDETKERLVAGDQKICASLASQLQEWQDLSRQLMSNHLPEHVQQMVKWVERIAERTSNMSEAWDDLEEGRRALLTMRQKFDRMHLQRIERGMRNSELSEVTTLQELDEAHDELKEKTGNYIIKWDETCQQDSTDLAAMRHVNLEISDVDALQSVTALRNRLDARLAERSRWTNDMNAHYHRNRVYGLDDDYRRIRNGMEIWEPLS